MIEKAADDPVHEGNRNKDGDNGPGAGHDGDADFGRAFRRGLHGGHAFLELAVDAFENHDCVVDEKADRDRECHEGQVVEREIGDVEREESGDQRCGHGDCHDHGRAEVEQEGHRDDNHEENAQHDVEADVVDRILDEQRCVAGEDHVDAGGQERAHLLDLGLDGLGDLDRVLA